jgi:hypothetical protein
LLLTVYQVLYNSHIWDLTVSIYFNNYLFWFIDFVLPFGSSGQHGTNFHFHSGIF